VKVCGGHCPWECLDSACGVLQRGCRCLHHLVAIRRKGRHQRRHMDLQTDVNASIDSRTQYPRRAYAELSISIHRRASYGRRWYGKAQVKVGHYEVQGVLQLLLGRRRETEGHRNLSRVIGVQVLEQDAE
jgi:hypothetical protein